MLYRLFSFGFFSLSSNSQFRCTTTFSMQFPGKLQNLEFVLFVKLYSTGIASNMSILSIVCANESLSGSSTLSVFLA